MIRLFLYSITNQTAGIFRHITMERVLLKSLNLVIMFSSRELICQCKNRPTLFGTEKVFTAYNNVDHDVTT